MPEKAEPAEGWPVVEGDYVVGDPEAPVHVVTLGSHIEEDILKAAGEDKVAIAGPCKTENIGIEKVIANVIANPNIRFGVLCGAEVTGHLTGQCFKAMYENGVDPDSGEIIGAEGAIPYLENIPEEAVERYRDQIVELVDLIDVEDVDEIVKAIEECVEKDPGAYEEGPMTISLEEEEEEELAEVAGMPVSAETVTVEYRINDVRVGVKSIGAMQRYMAGYLSGRTMGLLIGIISGMIFLFLPMVVLGGV
ncbi:tetrahydromethanopterin S-methyltransferase subunit A [Methanopyrus kandleri]|uniref:Tetrahydromethanopterin S-methyltransferase subunit A n=2 Tax=Methanopyrus kandleri TaxID=2320 RepID=MTRA_METKA|nr:tetrahydromethanopterin S-methyltransferase subunit A [Methanopyrus kandleri]O32867.3 RecName: Full=Tetrahydromethanopterin S-methyltransferase subunit A; AltName: Full=N5-methyltetrahydromethanopterin--coenzyme M methyltransferase subunit A [Methanopyrus kandleri AV19]CAA74771.1 N5-methyltetrahydromethanopterin:coenzyme M methyltransferase, subunit MtrA [Methanopyrus kandleri]HII70115.1 tetrahydromethanopterin S-methyltransferase subunit A [Methanopyrus kandleri]